MSGCSEADWSHVGPSVSGYYEVRPCPQAWDLGPNVSLPAPRIAYVDVSTGRFDAKTFGGSITNPFWEWLGPIEMPTAA